MHLRVVEAGDGGGRHEVAAVHHDRVVVGLGDAAVAGGMENMDRAPYLLDGGRWGYRMGDGQLYDTCCVTD